MFLLFVGGMMPLNQQRMVGKCFDVREHACVCACPPSPPPQKESTQKSPLYIWQLPLVCVLPVREKREIYLQVFLAVNLLYLH